MTKAAIFTMKFEPDLHAAFMAEAAACHRPASQVARELMREFVRRQREERDHAAFPERKVVVARGSVEAARPRE
jgi:predicted transcriptional regulator